MRGDYPPNKVNERLAKQEENVGNDGDGVKKLQESIHRVDGQSTEAVNRHTAAGQDDAVSREAARTADSANREQLAARKKQIEAGIAAGKTFDADAMRELGLHDVKYGGETYTPHTFTKEPTANGSAEYRPVYRMEHENGDVSFHTFQEGHEGALMPMAVGRARYDQETGKYNLASEHLAEGANAGQLTEAEMTAVLNGGKATDARDLAYQPNAGPMPQHHEHDRQPPRPEEKPVWTPPGQSDPGAGPSMNPSQQQDYLASQLRSTLERNRGAEAAAQFDQLTGEGGLSPSDAMGRIMRGKK